MWSHLPRVVGRRLLPPTGPLRSAAPTVDPLLLRGASVGAAWRADRGGAVGAVYHSIGSGVLPIGSGLPIVVTLLDVAAWELPGRQGRIGLARFGSRLRRRLVHDAAAVVVGTDAAARTARRLLRIPPDRIHVVPLAPRPAFAPGIDAFEPVPDEGARLGLGDRYLVWPGRYDARQDLAALFGALQRLTRSGRPAGLPPEVAWPPRIALVGATPDDRAAIARAAARQGVGEAIAHASPMPDARLADLIRRARATILPMVADTVGLAAIELLAVGTPVVASSVGALPEIVGPAGLLVPTGDPDRLATALRAAWTEDALVASLAEAARDRTVVTTRTWADVAEATRRIYARVGVRSAT